MPTTENTSPTTFEGNTPILRVQSLAASIDYYIHKLGFDLKWQSPIFACVARGRCHIFLSEGDQGHPGSWVWIGVGDADALLDEYRRTGAKIAISPQIIPGPTKCKSKIPTATFCAVAPNQKKTCPKANGWT